jgi:DNA-binding NarL/FixJ family response regulator
MSVRILIADDDAIIREALSELLAAQGFDVIGAAADGAEAIESAVALRPDVVLVDIRMPRVNGIEAIQRISAEVPAARLVALSAYDDPALSTSARAAGAVDYVTKGTPPAELCRRIREVSGTG